MTPSSSSRRALPAARERLLAVPVEERRLALATLLGSLLTRILGVSSGQLAADRPLTASGLDSLRAIELCHVVEAELGVDLPMVWLLEGATPADLEGEVLRRLAEAPAGGESETSEDGAPGAVSPGQRALWLLDRLAPESAAYVLAGAARVMGDVDGAVLHRALDILAERHPALRTVFAESAGEPVPRPIAGPAVEWREEDGAVWSDEELARRLADRAYRPFDLAAGPLLRAGLVARGRREPVLWLAVHHIAADFWSVEVLLGELAQLYRGAGRAEGVLPPAAPAPRPPGAPAQPATDAETQRLLAFWRAALADKPQVLELPTDRPRGRAQSFRGDWRTARLPADLTGRLRELGRAESATLFVTLAAGFGALLARTSGQDEPLFGTPTSGRGTAELAGAVGYFVNPVVLAADLSGDPSAAQVLARMRRTALAAFAHQKLPFPLLAEQAGGAERDPSRSPIFQAMLALQGGRGPLGERLAALALGAAGAAGGTGSLDLEPSELGHLELDLGGLRLAPLPLAPRGAQLDLTLACSLLPGAMPGAIRGGEPAGLAAALTFNSDLFDGATALRLLGHFAALLDGMASDPAARVWELPLLSPAERAQLAAWGGGEGGAPPSASAVCLHELFALQAARTPEATAVIAGGAAGFELTYRELARRVAGLAAVLRAAEVAPEVRVGICLERTPAMIVALLAVLAAGGAYVPLDPDYPRDRLAFTAADSGMTVLLTQAALRGRVPEDGLRVIVIDAADIAEAAAAALPLRGALGEAAGGPLPGNLAYVIYTSGSTGRPKGAAIEHATAVVFVEWARSVFSAEELAGVLAASSICFDYSIFEIFVPLASGGAVVLAANALELPELAAADRVTLVATVPSAMAELVGGGRVPSSVRTVSLGGEALPPSLAEAIRRRTRATRLLNLYGPSEVTTCSTWWAAPLAAADAADAANAAGTEAPVPTLGRPISGTRVHLLGPGLAPVPVGVAGEVWIGGQSVSRGYLGRPELTAERFLPDPFAAAPGRRLYRAGDLARWRPDGELEFLGRVDHQVKIRGFRVEPGEVEAALEALPGVGAAAVVAGPAGPPGTTELRLVAYAVLAPDAEPGSAATAESLRRDLALHLPQHLVPAAIVLLPELPRFPNGKLERRRLPEPEWSDGAPAVPPRTPLEARLAGIFGEVLGIGAVGIHDSFFALGGHSLLAARALARVRAELGLELPLRALFESPTVAGLARRLETARRERASMEVGAPIPPPIPPTQRPLDGTPLPLSFAQERLWFLDRLAPGGSVYNVAAAVRLRGGLEVAALAAAFREIARRHEVLGATYGASGGTPFQRAGAGAAPELPRIDLGALPAAAGDAVEADLTAALAERPFDLARGPLLRTVLLRRSAADHLLVVTMHHIVSDGWSMGILVDELGALYAAAVARRSSPLAALPIQYADYAAWQQRWMAGEVLAGEIAHWRAVLAGLPAALELPADRPRPTQQSFRGAERGFALPPALWSGLGAAARRSGVTLYMLLLAAFDVLLYRLTGQRDLAVGSPIAGRTRAETFGLIGLFVNTLMLRGEVAQDDTLATLLPRLRETALTAYAHQELPFEKLVEALAPARDLSRSPLVQVMFALQNAPLGALTLPGLTLEPLRLASRGAKLDLTLSVVEADGGDGGAMGYWEYATDLFDRTTVARFAERFAALLAGAVVDLAGDAAGRPLDDLPLLSAAERQQLREWNDTPALPAELTGTTLYGLIAAQIERTPGAVAVSLAGEELTYRQLGDAAERLARRLAGKGVGPGVLVGLCAERSLELMVGLVATLAAGAAYVPLDPAYPAERLASMVEDAAVGVLLTHGAAARALPRQGAAIIDLDLAALLAAVPERSDLRLPAADPDDLAYVIYTSGSTGKPKGAMNSHRAVVNRLLWMQQAFGLTGEDRVLQKTPISFDVSVWELFWPLVAGARLVLARPGGHQDAAYLARLVAEERITTVHFVPSMLKAFVAAPGVEACTSLRLVVASGEVLPWELVRRLAERNKAPLWNLYGPTEAAVDVTFQDCREGAGDGLGGSVPIGRPISGVEIRLLDPSLRPVPVGGAGELAIGGLAPGRGYWRRPDLTAERFVPDPLSAFSGVPGGRLYRTGDLARFRADGRLDYLGRLDQQVKVRGVRVELGEIEAALAAHPAVAEAVVMLRPELPGGGLAAYLVPRPQAEPGPGLDRAELRRHLAARLPEAMVPAAFVLLAALPLTPSGKVDRRALPAPSAEDRGAGAGSAVRGSPPRPFGPIEELLAGIWTEVLGIDAVSIDDDFFALGGHSLLATQVLARLKTALAVELPVAALFAAPTIAAFAERVEAAVEEARRPEAARAAAPPLVARPAAERTAGEPPLSFGQERLWFLDQLTPGGTAYNLPVAIRLRGALDVAALAGAFGEIVRRHESLRTTFAAGESGAWQRVGPPSPSALSCIDLGSLPAAARMATGIALAMAEAERPFDLACGPLLRTALVRLSGSKEAGEAGDHLLLVTMHHIVSDGWSIGILVHELGALYAAAVARRPRRRSPLEELPIQYADYAAWQRRWMAGEVLAGEIAHWRAVLAGLPAALELPADRPRPAQQSFRGAERGFALPSALWSGLGAAARRSGVTLYMLLLAAFDVLLYRLTGQRDLAVGSPIAGRTRAETFGLIGLFVNTLVLRGEVAQDDTLATLLPRLRETALTAYAHQDLPFEKLVEALAPARDPARSPLVQVMLALQNAPLGALTLPGLTLEPLRLASRGAKLDLTLSVVEADDRGAIGYWEYATDLFDRTTIARFAERFAALLAGAVVDLAGDAAAGRRVDDLPFLSAAERQQLREWNDTPALPAEAAATTLYGLIAAQIERTPGAVAVSLAGDELTYRQLGDAAERLARQLAGKGVGPGVLVGLCAERSLELVVGLVAILAAGAAYVPLDPAYPAERLAYMVEDAAVGVLLTHGAAAHALPRQGAEVIEIDLAALLAALPERSGPRLPAVDPDDLAYVIYTSGSTGSPKGAMNRHRAVVNRLLWMQQAFGLTGEDRVLQKTPISFDVSVWELFWPLLVGARLVLARPGGHQDAAYLARLIALERITTVHFVPSMLKAFVAAPGVEACTSLRRVIASGEALPRELVRRFAERNKAPLWNLYGPTEAAVDVTFQDGREGAGGGEGGSVPIGRPISGVEIRLLDPSLRPVPVGGAGELAIGGLAPGRGYWRRPDLTAERFVPDPLSGFSGGPGGRLYRTGDLARFSAAGSLDYLGRLDHQVKVRGVRIELGEVEAVLAAHPAVAEVVVMLRPELPGGGLVAYLTHRARRGSSSEPLDAELKDDLRAFLAARLPGPMIPNAFVPLPAMPLTPTGKLDRRALLAIEPGVSALAEGGGFVAPRNPVEALFAGIWAEVLGSGRQGREISVHDNFFELGGNSILSIQIVARAARAGYHITPRQLFEQQTVARLAMAAGTAAHVVASQGPVTGPLPLTPIQRWFFGQDLADPHHFNQAVLLAVREVGPRVAESALGALVRHHDALRLRVLPAAEEGGLPRVENAPPEPGFFLPRVDLTALAPTDAERALGAAADAAQASLDLARGPLLRFVWYQLAGGARLLLAIHHLAVDGVSWRILLEDLETACRQVAAGGPAALRLPAKTTSFKEWAERLDAYAQSLSPEAVERELGHWTGLARLPFDRLPFEPAERTEQTGFDSFAPTALAPAAATGFVASSRTVTVELDEAETRALLTELPSAYGTQVNEALLAALAATLARPGGALWIDLEGHGREEVVPGVDLSRTVGWFTTLFPVALAVESTAPGVLLQSVKEQLRAIPDRGFGYGVLRYLRGGEAAALLAALPAPRVSFNYLGEFDGSFEGGLFAPAAEPSGAAQSPRQRRPHVLAVSLLVVSGRLRVDWGYSADLCDRGRIERLATAYAASLRELLAHCRAAGTAYTPGDFTYADLQADDLANLLAELDEA